MPQKKDKKKKPPSKRPVSKRTVSKKPVGRQAKSKRIPTYPVYSQLTGTLIPEANAPYFYRQTPQYPLNIGLAPPSYSNIPLSTQSKISPSIETAIQSSNIEFSTQTENIPSIDSATQTQNINKSKKEQKKENSLLLKSGKLSLTQTDDAIRRLAKEQKITKEQKTKYFSLKRDEKRDYGNNLITNIYTIESEFA
jgi:hypothetical protein